ncbi:hypothetical protein GCM10007905_09900 [Mixta theicola]|nr:hypothetical protein GCM10007905_09900 [Mixta theicola]
MSYQAKPEKSRQTMYMKSGVEVHGVSDEISGRFRALSVVYWALDIETAIREPYWKSATRIFFRLISVYYLVTVMGYEWNENPCFFGGPVGRHVTFWLSEY